MSNTPYYESIESIVKDIYGEQHSSKLWNEPLSDLQKSSMQLLACEQYESVQWLARLDNSKCEAENRSKTINTWLIGECHLRQKQYHIAKDWFQSICPGFEYKVAVCLHQTGSLIEAMCLLENIPNKDYATHMLLAKLYAATSRKEAALEQYQFAISMNPYGLEAVVEAMQKLGGDKKPYESCIVPELSMLLFTKYRHQTNLSLQHAQNLNQQFPNNVYIKLILAELHSENNDNETAAELYVDIRQLEPTCIHSMDRYASILGESEQLHELSTLADTMLRYNDQSPVTWTIVSLFHKYNDQTTLALKFIEKAISMDVRHAYAHFVRGTILLQDGRPDYAGVSFFRSNEIQPCIETYEGLVDAYLDSGKEKEAIAAAKEVYHRSPRDPRTLTLVGLALSQGNSGQATRSLTKALSLAPALSRPLFCLVEIHKASREYDTCLSLLRNALQHTDSKPCQTFAKADAIYCSMGSVHVQQHHYKLAVEQYNTALVHNPDCATAVEQLEALDKLLRGNGSGDDLDDVEIVEDQSAETPTNY